jgi:hypothetical protein
VENEQAGTWNRERVLEVHEVKIMKTLTSWICRQFPQTGGVKSEGRKKNGFIMYCTVQCMITIEMASSMV